MMFDVNDTLVALMNVTQDPAGKIRFQFAFANSYEAFANAAEAAIEWVLHQIELNPQLYEEQKEDQITEAFIIPLKAMNVDALHDPMIGGHGDIVIRGKDDFIWIAECKFFASLSKVLGGYSQLLTRYSTGQLTCSRGSLILYVQQADALSKMKAWREHLAVQPDEADTVISDCTISPLAFLSKRKHPRTGLPYGIRHVSVCLNYSPAPTPIAGTKLKPKPKTKP